MIPIQDLINKIRYSPAENPEDYTLFYYDRVEDKLKPLKLTDINKIEEGFLTLKKQDRETNLPLHRIKKVKKKEKIVWERKLTRNN